MPRFPLSFSPSVVLIHDGPTLTSTQLFKKHTFTWKACASSHMCSLTLNYLGRAVKVLDLKFLVLCSLPQIKGNGSPVCTGSGGNAVTKYGWSCGGFALFTFSIYISNISIGTEDRSCSQAPSSLIVLPGYVGDIGATCITKALSWYSCVFGHELSYLKQERNKERVTI